MSNPQHSIKLIANRASVEPGDVLFAFPSGRLAYDCVACGGLCCRGHDYTASVDPEYLIQIRRRPAIALFTDAVGSANELVTIQNLAPGCFFLSAGGRCEIHEQVGPHAKPATCRLFPFNDFLRLDRYLVVRPHRWLCPLECVDADNRSMVSAHLELIAEMTRDGIVQPVRQVSIGADIAERVVARERQVVALCDAFRFGDDCLSFFAALGAIDEGANSIREELLAQTRSLIATAADVVGTPGSESLEGEAALLTTIAVAIPFIRSTILFGNQGIPPRIDGSRLWLMTLATTLLAAAARNAGMREVTFQSVSQLVTNNMPLVALIAMLDAVVEWRPNADLELQHVERADRRIRLLRVVRELLPSRQRRTRKPLGSIVRSELPQDDVERGLFVRAVAQAVYDRVQPINARDARPKGPLSRRIRCGVQRWALSTFDDEVLASLHSRNSERSRTGKNGGASCRPSR